MRVTATLVEVLRPSPDRVTPRCPHFGPQRVGLPCGGCAWQHIAYPAQLTFKRQLVADLLARSLEGTTEVRPTIPGTSPDVPWAFRNKLHLVVGSAPTGMPVVGHYARGSRRIVPIEQCPVHEPRGHAVALAFGRALTAAASRRAPSTVRGIAVRSSTGSEVMAALVVARDGDPAVRTACKRVLVEQPAITSFHVNVHPKSDGFIFGAETRHIAGLARLRERVDNTTFLISPTAFFQTNVRAAERMVRLVLDLVPPVGPVLDLYAGSGLFALPLAARGHRVVAVESNRAAVRDGLANLAANGLDRDACRFIAAPVLDALRRLRPHVTRTVVLDPPREGCEAAVITDVFGRLRPERAVYVSCHPEALARDLARTARHGYSVQFVQPVDMFPHTPHVEAIALLVRRTTAIPLSPGRPD